VIGALADVMVLKGVPEHLRSDNTGVPMDRPSSMGWNGPEFVARALRKWRAAKGAKTLYIEPGSPWENGYCESFNSKRDVLAVWTRGGYFVRDETVCVHDRLKWI
jgi:transposase InsO family protein